MPTQNFPIDKGWTPDLSLTNQFLYGGLNIAKNVYPINQEYWPVFGKTIYNDTAISGIPINGITMQYSDGTFYNFLGSSTKLYRFDSANMTDVTRASGGAYDATVWNFERYGTWLIATNYTDAIQVIKGISSASNFETLGGSPSNAKYLLLNSGHLILGNLTDYPKKIQWSAREDIEDYTASLTTGAGSQNFPDLDGNINGMGAIGDAFVIASQNSLTIGYYVGGTYTFNFRINAIKNIGCFYPQSFISIGNEVFFWGRDTIYRFNGSDSPVDIGKYVKKTIFDNVNIAYIHKITVCHDKMKNLIIWAYTTSGSTGNPDRLLVYNYIEDRFSYIELDCYNIFMGSSGGILLDSLTESLIDDNSYLIDSNYFINNAIVPMVVDTDDGKVKTLSGDTLTAEIETGEFKLFPKAYTVNKVYLPLEGATSTGAGIIKHRYSPNASQNSSSSSSIKSDATIDLRITDRMLSLNLQISNLTKLGSSIDAEVVPNGDR